jgi:hypothetical protein
MLAEKLPSTKPLHKSVQYWRNQKAIVFEKMSNLGEDSPFLQ